MKLLVIFSVFFVSLVASQDILAPRNLTGGSVLVPAQRLENIGGRLRVVEDSDDGFVPRCAQQAVRGSRIMSSLAQCDIVPPIEDLEVIEPDPEPLEVIASPPEYEYREIIEETVQQCPIGQTQSGSQCISLYECPEGHERRGGRCVRIYIECPTGSRMEGSRCVPIVHCPKNYEKRGGKCVIVQPECPSGFDWNGQQCVVTEIECSYGYTYSRSSGQCIREYVTCLPDEYKVGEECRKREVECEIGYTKSASGFCVKRTAKCDVGFTWNGSTCSRRKVVQTQPRLPRPEPIIRRPQAPPARLQTSRCPPGYQLYQGSCYKCSDVPQVERQPCQMQTSQGCCTQSSQPAPNININVHNHGGGGSGSGKGYNIVNNIHPANNTIYNVNNVTAPITINNVNENTITIQHSGHCRDGAIKTTVIRNNVTEHSCTDVAQESGEEIIEQRPRKCCEVSTPRQCQQTNGSWGCGHRRYKYCGDFCASSRVQLRPQQNTFSSGVLTFAPVAQPPQMIMQSSFGHGGGYMDCSGCQNGSFNCSPQCYSYPCQSGGACTYMDQQDFCGAVGGNACH